MKSHKTPEEMKILIEKINNGEIKWDEIDQEVAKMRKAKKITILRVEG
jgi:hypothetical protein